MSEWQPIDSAPRNEPILARFVWDDDLSENGVYAVRWHDHWQEWVLHGVLIALSNDKDPRHPTHWMPLPEPPRS